MDNKLITYAQNREDLILYVLLHDVKNGFYVDIGANDPVLDSVTKFFYDKGWHGINIEPIKSVYDSIAQNRIRDINLNVGISNKEGKLTLREYGKGKHGWSTLSADIKKEHQSEVAYKDYEVKVVTLASVLNQHNVKKIDFLKVDVEGFELEVLSSNDWSKFRPKVIVVEDTYPEKWTGLLKRESYDEVFHDGLNRYFVRHDLLDKNTMKDYKDVLLSGTVATTAYYKSLEEQYSLTEKWLKNEQKQLHQERIKYGELQQEYDKIASDLAIIQKRPENKIGLMALILAIPRRIVKKLIGRV